VRSVLLVAGGDPPALLEPIHEPLDVIPLAIRCAVERSVPAVARPPTSGSPDPPDQPAPPGAGLLRHPLRAGAAAQWCRRRSAWPKIIGFLFRFFPMWPKLKAVAHALPYDLTIMADTAILDGAAEQVKVPTLVAGGAKARAHSRRAVERVYAAIPGSQLPWLEGQTHNLAAEPAAARAKEFFLAGDVDFRYPRTTYG
jgi:pimeloyl-ACP methyl ester carboxylesterase